jgi:hypothetical protein
MRVSPSAVPPSFFPFRLHNKKQTPAWLGDPRISKHPRTTRPQEGRPNMIDEVQVPASTTLATLHGIVREHSTKRRRS